MTLSLAIISQPDLQKLFYEDVMKSLPFYRAFSLTILTTMLVVSLAACRPAAQTGNIAVSGAFALYPMMVSWADEYQKLNPGVRIDVSAGGAGKGMTDALSGTVDIGMISRDIKPEEISQGAFPVGVVKDAVFGIISDKNPYFEKLMSLGLSKETLAKIYLTGEYKTWGQVLNDPQITDEIHIYTRSDSCGAAEMWSKFLGGKVQEDLNGIGVSGDPGITDAVIKDSLGIGYNNLNYAFDPKSAKPVSGIAVLPVDANQNSLADQDEKYLTRDEAMQAVASGKYPSPPARILYLVTKSKPTGQTKDFIEWILKDGQKLVSEAGYISLPEAQIKTELEKLK
jgi:phosphate transport system substrate-binding protein